MLKEDKELVALFKRNRELAWEIFLERYSDMMLKYISSRIRHRDDIMQVYASVCDKLSANNFRVIKQYQGRRNSRLSTWLVAVLNSHCADWYRNRMGRRRYFQCLQKMASLLRLVYRYYYWDRMPYGQIAEQCKCAHLLEEMTPADISSLVAKLNRTMGSKNIWKSTVAPRLWLNQPVRFEEHLLTFEEGGRDVLSGQVPDADRHFLLREVTGILKKAFNGLSAEEREMLQLLYWENRTARNIARHMKFENEFMVYQKRDGILKRIKKWFQNLGLTFSDFSPVMELMDLQSHRERRKNKGG